MAPESARRISAQSEFPLALISTESALQSNLAIVLPDFFASERGRAST
ncbi:hypothetical protein [Novosphingobium sp. ZW T3_23]